MEFQNANNQEEQEYEEINNNGDKKMYECECGCGLTFIKGAELGFKLKTAAEPEDIIYEDKIDGRNWKEYIPEAFIQTWGEFMDLIENSSRNQPNDRVWFHLQPYLQNRNLVVDDMPLEFEYMN